ncbi:MAG: hypothetical protein KJ893_06760 [Candidatus Omnitrophica bacterium]|nr:hypothetical protein [Candidatus Omnitrophota bacterium]MCG2703744.1 hypothetical protein [Candidatus Omnitrophota bacterium]
MKLFQYRWFGMVLGGVVIAGGIMSSVILAQAGSQAGDVFLSELKSKAEQMRQEGRLSELMDYLEKCRERELDTENLLYIDYYSILAKSLYLDMLEKKEDWAAYFNTLHSFDKEIIDTARQYLRESPSAENVIDMQYLAWKAYNREEDEAAAAEAFKTLSALVVQYTEKNNDISKFQEIAGFLAEAGKVTQMNRLFSGYKDYLLKTSAGRESIERLTGIAEEYFKEGKPEIARVVYEHYINLALTRYSQEDGLSAGRRIIERFRNHGFFPAKDADFAENIYERLESNFGTDVFDDKEVFARGYNLECLGEYERANEGYKQFVRLFPKSVFLPEVYTRLGILNLYKLAGDIAALAFWQKIIDEYPDSSYGPWCMYQTAMFLQWKKEDEKAAALYRRLADKEPRWQELSQKRLKEITGRLGMERYERYPLDILFDPNHVSSIVLTLENEPMCAFTDKNMRWSATAQDFSSGTVQPLFTYQWFGDTGSSEAPGNVTQFTTTYSTAGPYLACFSAITGNSENIIFKDAWIYDIAVNFPLSGEMFTKGSSVNFNAKIIPATIEENIFQWDWSINGPETIQGQGAAFAHSFSQAGHYEAAVEILLEGMKLGEKRFAFDIVE